MELENALNEVENTPALHLVETFSLRETQRQQSQQPVDEYLYRIGKHCSNQLVAGSTSQGRVLLYDCANNCFKAALQVSKQKEALSECFWFNSSQLLLAEKYDVLRYDVETQTIISRYEGQTQTIQAINFNLFHNLILAGGSEKVIMVYDTRTRNPVNALMAHGQDITSLSFSLDSQFILSSAQDGFTRIWSLHSGLCKTTLLQDTSSVPTVSHFTSNARFVLQATLSSQINLWDWRAQEIIRTYRGHINRHAFYDTFFLKKALERYTHVVGYSEDGQLIVWDLLNAQVESQLQTVSQNNTVSGNQDPLYKKPYQYDYEDNTYENIYLYDCADFSVRRYAFGKVPQ